VSVEALTPPVARERTVALRRHAPLAAILALAAVLDCWKLAQNGYANAYYAGAVRSMTTSWHNFLFASFDQGGLVSVDKPPLALWVEAASAKAFGFSGVTILLPEAIAGVLAVWLLYLLVARYFGRIAGLVAALALAVSPVSVAINRDNNPDALFALLLVASVWAGARAVESGRLRWLLASALLVGVAFNTKMLAAGIVVPGLALGYLLFARRPWLTRIGHLLGAGLVLALVSSAWIALVELTPADARPYVGSTDDNSALSLALGYNGLGRVLGQSGGTSFGGGGGGGLGGAFSGTPGFFRLINDALGDQGGWLLPLAIVGGVSAAIYAWRRRRGQLGPLVMIGGWFAAGAVVFSYSSGIVHTYYLSALAPATSALVGIGAVSLARDARRGGLWVIAPLLAILFTAWLELALLDRSGYDSWLKTVVLFAAFVAGAAVVALAVGPDWPTATCRLIATGAIAVAVTGFLAPPAAWSATTLKGAVNGVFPGAGPSFISGLGSSQSGGLGFRGGGGPPGGGFGFNGGGSSSSIETALAYAQSHGATSRFPLIVTSEQEAAQSVIAGEPVASMGGFTGRETVLTNAYLAKLVRSGEARYFLLGGTGFGGGRGGGSNAAIQTIESTCTQVSSVSGLYDCAGRADAIAAAG
jgi:4-amino-4-deoxy-L-arabinose transferase-like glycosyltransferase